ncbi:MAG TPA: hypothetical protein VLC09_09520, partial [Polyangiaceae bacterium]|nr:hypothetical protein [Polyangiaceae bacterium]
ETALYLYRKLAAPAFALAFTFGAARLVMDLRGYFVVTHFMHGKLTLAVAVIGLHHVIGARAKKRAAGQSAGGVTGLAAGLAVASLLVVYFAVFKPF